eukprot:CAMPEP_0197034268 /NCGR_PEP_ID=MMETSP1384-20130603/12434_1 /TAXON_ID=29189 /ORGANISM="Ammonia sp." /LENGTH=425 /DNA_ID=CAMNT_0042464175 /DNA_START=24 /DNA_END=1301 /DNA_ORIENTATION=+
MGQGQGCCSGEQAAEQKLKAEARNGMTTGRKNPFLRQSTALDMTALIANSSTSSFYGNLVVSCVGGGACKSKFSALLLSIQQNAGCGKYDSRQEETKQDLFSEEEKTIIREELGSMLSKTRKYFTLLLENTENADKYMDLYNSLEDTEYSIDTDENALFILRQIVKIIENGDEYLLQCLANFTCTFSSRPLWSEIIENSKENDDLKEKDILDRVDKVHQTEFYKEFSKSGIQLADNEILAIYIFTATQEFSRWMQHHMKIPCKWKQTFYYFVRGILKIYDVCVFRAEQNKLPKKLYHAMFGQPRISAPYKICHPINCTEKEQMAKEYGPADGSMFVFENADVMMSKGQLIAAPIHWISPHPEEQEWIILPVDILAIGEEKTFSSENDIKEVAVTKYRTFSAALYGVNIFEKLGDLKFVQDMQRKG